MSDATSGTIRLRAGDRVTSRWSGQSIAVERFLGEGANGSVYLARLPDGSSHCALKIGNDIYALQSEINALKSVGGDAPRLLLADDGSCRGVSFPFYVMSFVPGKPLGETSFGADAGALASFGADLLGQLRALHAAGWAFGDVKPDNVMIGRQGEVRLVDYGGATRFGSSVKQFTELYDRGYWKLGGRRAEAAYDLFAFAVVMLEAAGLGRRVRAIAGSSRRDKAKELVALVDESPLLAGEANVLKRLLRGECGDTEQALGAWRAAAAKPLPRHAPAAGERWPAYWFAGAAAAFAGAVWWMSGNGLS
ncbi:serine/threonine protein kinase [Paenibacillus sp.]|uniref:protein kinase domain-containing protein n=1 Tax=Paenibacillus sp. TaxID=58172 RepID=UPI002811A6FC|nr:serine/threonine protein kinase [Paenibacillus sp.]